MSLTTDPNDPSLGRRGADTKPVPQNEKYLVLSEEECAKGFVRPVRRSYVHVGTEVIKGCGVRTTMAIAIAETYARNPNFYGATYCCGCGMHRPVGPLPKGEFVWDGTDQRVGT